MRKRVWIVISTVIVALVVATSALAYSHSGPFYTSSYNSQIWNYGTGVGPVSGTTAADGLSIPSSLAGGFEETSLRLLGTCSECEIWTGAPSAEAWVSTNSYGSLKVVTGISSRYFTMSGNLGNPATSAHVTGQILCGIGSVENAGWINDACGAQPVRMTAGYAASTGTNGPSWYGLPAGALQGNYAQWLSTLTGCTAAAGGQTWSNDAVIVKPTDMPGTGEWASAVTCGQEVWNAVQSIGCSNGSTVFATCQIGSLVLQSYHMVTSDCQNYEMGTYNANVGNVKASYTGNGCWELYALHPAVEAVLEHTVAVPFTTQTALATRTLSPVLTTTPVALNLLAARIYVDAAPDAYTNEWNCLLLPSTYTCPSNVPPVPPTPSTTDCVNVPKPLVGEVYNDYVTRLRADGYSQTVVQVNDPFTYPAGSDEDLLAPYSVTGVTALGGATAYVYDSITGARKAWPSVPPAFCSTTVEIDVYTVPSSSTGTGPATSGIPSIDVSPLTSIAYGTKFPFGIYDWLHYTLYGGSCVSTGGGCNNGAPHFTLTKPGGGTIFVDLSNGEWVATYRPIVFGILEFFMVVGGTWFLAWRILGIGGGGSVSDDE